MSTRERLEPLLQRELSSLIPTLKDPRIPLVVTVETVSLSPDGRLARVSVSTLDDEDSEAMLEALNRASGYLQRELAADLGLKFTPKLRFQTSVLGAGL